MFRFRNRVFRVGRLTNYLQGRVAREKRTDGFANHGMVVISTMYACIVGFWQARRLSFRWPSRILENWI
jgi:hypothetical protein